MQKQTADTPTVEDAHFMRNAGEINIQNKNIQ
jgi:hypothetical protein